VPSRITLDHGGAVIGEHPHPQVLTAWGRLYALLRAALPEQRYHCGKHLVDVTQTAEHVEAHFADGSTAQAELLIAADGIRSSVRQVLVPEIAPAITDCP